MTNQTMKSARIMITTLSVALVTPLLLLIRNGPGRLTSWLAAGWGYGALFYAVQYSWLSRTLLELGGVAAWRFVLFSVAGLSFLALFPALAIAGSRFGWMRFGLSPFWTLPLLLGRCLPGFFLFLLRLLFPGFVHAFLRRLFAHSVIPA